LRPEPAPGSTDSDRTNSMFERGELAAMERQDSQPSDEVTGADQESERVHQRKGSSLPGVQQLKGVQDIGTGLNRRMRAIPKRDEHYYLDLYLLQKERERLTQEGVSIGKRRTRLGRRLAVIRDEMVDKERKALEDMNSSARPTRSGSRRSGAPSKGRHRYQDENWQRMPINY
jgi:hypothetical protein